MVQFRRGTEVAYHILENAGSWQSRGDGGSREQYLETTRQEWSIERKEEEKTDGLPHKK
jgi:hypothetical protein